MSFAMLPEPKPSAALSPVLAPIAQTRTFARGIWRIAAADVSAGNRVTLLRDGPATFAAMQAMIEDAVESVDFEQYIFRPDEVGLQFRDALAAAAKRGVRVRCLIDWVGRMGTRRRFFAPISEAGGEVRIFSPPGWRRWFGVLPRDHRKLLVTDRRIGVTGGIGIGREWEKRFVRRKRAPWRDTAIRIEGAAARDMGESFERMWERAGGRRWGRPRVAVRTPRSTHLDPNVDPPSLVGIIEGEPFRLRASRALQMQALSAERSIWIASAYFAPPWAVVEALVGAARDGVDVRVLIPSKYDHPWLRRFIHPYCLRLLRNGVRMWEWDGEMMHAKTSVIDGRWVRIGSTDFNILGLAINYELDAVIEDATLGALAAEMFLSDLEHSRELVTAGTGIVTGASIRALASPRLEGGEPRESGRVVK